MKGFGNKIFCKLPNKSCGWNKKEMYFRNCFFGSNGRCTQIHRVPHFLDHGWENGSQCIRISNLLQGYLKYDVKYVVFFFSQIHKLLSLFHNTLSNIIISHNHYILRSLYSSRLVFFFFFSPGRKASGSPGQVGGWQVAGRSPAQSLLMKLGRRWPW